MTSESRTWDFVEKGAFMAFFWMRPWLRMDLSASLPADHSLIWPQTRKGRDYYVPTEDHSQGDDSGPWLSGFADPENVYQPFDIPNLHRRFSRIELTEAAVIRFANRMGFLGHAAFLTISPGLGGLPAQYDSRRVLGGREAAQYERLERWYLEIARMKRLVELWDLIKTEQVGTIARWIRWKQMQWPRGTPWRVAWNDLDRPGGQFSVLGIEGETSSPMPKGWKPGAILEPAYFYLCQAITGRLSDHVQPVVMPFKKGDIMLYPDCLVAAMYVLFALEVSGKERPAIVCEGCGRYFIPVHGRQRHCEDRCRKNKWYRDHHPSIT